MLVYDALDARATAAAKDFATAVCQQVNTTFGTVPLLAVALTSGGGVDPGVILIAGVPVHPLASLSTTDVTAAFDALLHQWITAAAERYRPWDASRLYVATRPEMAPMTAWRPDRDVNKCTRCNTSFTMLNRRHHCRFCGDVFCNKCAPVQSHEGATAVGDSSTQPSGGGGGGGAERKNTILGIRKRTATGTSFKHKSGGEFQYSVSWLGLAWLGRQRCIIAVAISHKPRQRHSDSLPTHWPHPLTHSLTHSLTHPLTHSPACTCVRSHS
jgi:hypothetical protein